jgi:hypothetical protein
MTTDASTANEERADKLRRNSLERLARKQGLQLRHSHYGYSLIDRLRNQVDGRNNLTLDDVEQYVERSRVADNLA